MFGRLRSHRSGGIARAASIVVAGTAGAQLIMFAAAPVLSRLYSPEAFGMFAAFSALGAILASIGSLKYDIAVPLVASEEEAVDVARVGLFAAAATGSAVCGIVLVFSDEIQQFMGVGPSHQMLIGPYVFGVSSAAILGQLALRRKNYPLYARRKLLQAGSTVTAQVGGGLLSLGGIGLSLGLVIGEIVAFLSLIPKTPGLGTWSSIRSHYQVAVDNLRYPALLVPSTFLNLLGTQGPILLIIGFFGATVGGWLGLTQRVLAAPVGLIGTSLAQVYLGELASLKRKGVASGAVLFRQVSVVLCLAGTLLGVGVALLAELVFPILFGERWAMSGTFAQALSIGIVGQLIAAPLSQTLVVSGRLGWQTMWDAFRLLLTGGAVILPAIIGLSATATVWILGVAQGISYLILWLMCRFAASRLQREADFDTIRS